MSLETATSVVRTDEWPIGLKYKPSKQEYVAIIKKKFANEEIRYEKIVVLDSGDLYSNTPDVLFKDKQFSYKDKYVVVANRKPDGLGGFIRQLPSQFHASWDPCGELKAILAKDDLDTFIGVYQLYQFCYGKVRDPCGKVQTKWFMEEIQTLDPPECPLAIAVVYEVQQPQVLTALKAKKSAQQTLRHAKKRAFIADYEAKVAAKVRASVDQTLESAKKLFNDAADIADAVVKKQREHDRLTLTSNLNANKRKMASDQQPSSAAPITNKPRIKLRVICSRSQPSHAADRDQENV